MNIKNSLGLSIDFLDNGSVKNIDIAPIRVGSRPATPFSTPGTNLYLRKSTSPFEYTALIGPESNSHFTVTGNIYIAEGTWSGLDYRCTLRVSPNNHCWQWDIDIKNTIDTAAEFDLFLLQDVGLKAITTGLNNEYYVSQYLERSILEDKKYGKVICCRQNMAESVGNPWLIMACKNTAASASVDGMQFYGTSYRETGIPEGLLANELGGELAGESSVLALKTKTFKAVIGEEIRVAFTSAYLPDHPDAISEADLLRLPELMSSFEEKNLLEKPGPFFPPVRNLFNTSGFLPVDDLNEQELTRFFGDKRRFTEEKEGQLLSFFCRENNHVALRAKEISVDRPHAHIMQAKAGYAPDENIVSTTAYAFGIFNSHITQGNTNFNIFLSVCSSQFNLSTETGQRIFVEMDKHTYLLGVPSAFEMGLNHCRWIYKHGDYCFQVRTWTSKKASVVNMDFKVLSGKNVKLLITHHFDSSNGWKIVPGNAKGEYISRPGPDSMIAGKFPKAQFRIIVNSESSQYKACSEEVLYFGKRKPENSLFILEVYDTKEFCLSFAGEVCVPSLTTTIKDADMEWQSDCLDAQKILSDLCLNLSIDGELPDSAAIREILPWYSMNALTHYLTPYGLEQFSGAAWGTRDVSQGPFDLLLSMEKYADARKILCIIFSNQNTDGGWPQWWMFDSYTNIRADHSHGDVFYWCIIALSNYIKVTGDLKILQEILPYYNEKNPGEAEKTPLSEHINRLISMIVGSFVPGTALVPYGNGDWNDSLQPVSKELAERMISSWTVEMNFQAFTQYQKVFEQTGNTKSADELKEICARIKSDFNNYLIKDGVVAGYGLVEDDGKISLLLHPSDTKTNIQYSILPMNRGIISEIFTKEQALYHQDLIEQHLKGPDGARLMNRPLKYKGGIQTIFQRAESSTFFGREIGLMYVHEHIRYAESQAITGRPDAFLKALRQAIPVGYRDIVPCGDYRQSNCYYSSSDVTFKSRYEADKLYDQIKTGNITLKGGWRVYSSGPGIYVGLIISRLLGLRTESGKTIIDPVLPHSLDGLSASIDYKGHTLRIDYEVKENGYGPKSITVNDKKMDFNYEENIYRKGGAIIPTEFFLSILDRSVNTIKILL
jgi:cellobiose phosphorylase